MEKSSVSEPEPEPDPDPTRSGIISRIRIHNSNFGKDPELDFCLQTEFLPNNNVYLW